MDAKRNPWRNWSWVLCKMPCGSGSGEWRWEYSQGGFLDTESGGRLNSRRTPSLPPCLFGHQGKIGNHLMILTDTGDGVWQWPKHSLGMRSRKSFPRRAQRHELRKRASCVSKVGKKSIVKGSVQDIERQRTSGLFHGWKSHFRQVPKNSISHQPSII